MQLSRAIQSLREQESAAPATAGPPPPTNAPGPQSLASITATDDIAPYPMPLGMRVVKSRRKKRRLNEGKEDDEEGEGRPGLPELMQSLAREAEKTESGFVKMGFEFSLGKDDREFVMKAKTGREYVYRFAFNSIVMTLGRSEITWWEPVGIITSVQAYMSWGLPLPEEGMFVENIVWRIASESFPYVAKMEAMLEIRPFTDFSIEHPLPKDTMDEIAEKFIIVRPGEFEGGEYVMNQYSKKYGSLDETVRFEPLNAWNSRYWVDQDFKIIHAIMGDTEVAGHKAEITPSMVAWGDVARLRMFREFPSLLEVKFDDGSGEDKWCCVSVVPSLPHHMEAEYFGEVAELLPSISKFSKTQARIDLVKFLDGLWVENADQGGLGLGYAYYRDGQWGIDYANTGMGQGNLDSISCNSSITGYRWNVNDDGTLHLTVDGFVSRNVTKRGPSPSNLDIIFHPSTGLDKILAAIGRFTYCT